MTNNLSDEEKILNFSGGLVSPEGIFYPCRHMMHRELLHELKEKGLISSTDYQTWTEKLGWVHIQDHNFYCFGTDLKKILVTLKSGEIIHGRAPPTNEQQDFIYKFLRVKEKKCPNLVFKINGDNVKSGEVYNYFDRRW